MYSREEIEEAIRVYHEEGSCYVAQRRLGYPSCPKTIRRWVEGETRVAGRPPKKPLHLPYDEKVALVKRLLAGERAGDLAAEAGVSSGSLFYWRRQVRQGGWGAIMTQRDLKAGAAPPPGPSDDLEWLASERERLEMENAVLRETVKLLKKGLGAGQGELSNKEKTALVGALRDRFPLKGLLAAAQLARSSYFYHRAREGAPDKHAELRRRIEAVFRRSNATFGYRRVWAALRASEEPARVSEKVVRRLMAEQGCRVIYNKRKRGFRSYRGDQGEAPANAVGRDFHADAPNELWLTDITQFQLPGFKCYLSPMVDCFDGMVVSWRVGRRPDSELVLPMLDEAIGKLAEGQRPVCHTDRGIHYWWDSWYERCEAAGLTRSMSAKGCSPDNAACEGFFGRLKNEFFYHRDWRGVTFPEFKASLDSYITYYNEGRIKESLGWKSPAQYRQSLGLA